MKKKMLLVLGGLFVVLGMGAQEDKSVLEVHYKLRYHRDVGDTTYREDEFVLSQGERLSKFESLRTLRNREVFDSLVRAGATNAEIVDAHNTGRIPRSGSESVVMKNWPKEGQLVYINKVLMDTYGCEEPIPDFGWQLLEGDTVVAGYACQQAQAVWHGRTWLVWYALDLPYDNGPWKLGGLPGLILAARDAAGDYLYTAYEILKGSGHVIQYKQKYERTTQKKYQELALKMAQDPTAMLRQRYGNAVKIVSVKSDGTKQEGWVGRTPMFMELF